MQFSCSNRYELTSQQVRMCTLYLRNGHCFDYNFRDPDFVNEYNNFWCEVDKDQQANLWIPFRASLNDLSDSWNNVVSPEFIGTAIFVAGLLFLAGLIWLAYHLIKTFRWREKKPRKASIRAPRINPSSPEERKAVERTLKLEDSSGTKRTFPRLVVVQATLPELTDEIFTLMTDDKNGARASSLLGRIDRLLDKNGRYAQSVDEFNARQGLTEFRDKLAARSLEELDSLTATKH